MGGERYSDSALKVTEEGLNAGSRLAEKGAILLLVRGSTLHKKVPVGIADREVAFNQDVKAIRVKPELSRGQVTDEAYLFYWLKANEQKLLEMVENTGIGAGKLDTKRLQDLEIPLPNWSEQRKVVASASALEEKEILNSLISQTLGQIAQALFKSWFVDFEPVKAKMTALEAGGTAEDAERAAMQAISGKSVAELDTLKTQNPEQYDNLANTAASFPSSMVESELGEIPAGWQVKPLSEMTRLIGGGTPKKSIPEYWGGDILWFSVKDAPSEGGVFVVDTEEKITERGLQESSAKVLPIGTTIISARGTVGKLALTGRDMAMNQSCYGVRGAEAIGPYLNYLNLNRAVDKLKRNVHGAVFDTITRDTFKTVSLIQAPDEVIHEFEQIVTPLFEKIKAAVFETQTLAATRDTLLPKLLSGELSLPEAEADYQTPEPADV